MKCRWHFGQYCFMLNECQNKTPKKKQKYPFLCPCSNIQKQHIRQQMPWDVTFHILRLLLSLKNINMCVCHISPRRAKTPTVIQDLPLVSKLCYYIIDHSSAPQTRTAPAPQNPPEKLELGNPIHLKVLRN